MLKIVKPGVKRNAIYLFIFIVLLITFYLFPGLLLTLSPLIVLLISAIIINFFDPKRLNRSNFIAFFIIYVLANIIIYLLLNSLNYINFSTVSFFSLFSIVVYTWLVLKRMRDFNIDIHWFTGCVLFIVFLHAILTAILYLNYVTLLLAPVVSIAIIFIIGALALAITHGNDGENRYGSVPHSKSHMKLAFILVVITAVGMISFLAITLPYKKTNSKYYLTLTANMDSTLVDKLDFAVVVSYKSTNSFCGKVSIQYPINQSGISTQNIPLDAYLPGFCDWRPATVWLYPNYPNTNMVEPFDIVSFHDQSDSIIPNNSTWQCYKQNTQNYEPTFEPKPKRFACRTKIENWYKQRLSSLKSFNYRVTIIPLPLK